MSEKLGRVARAAWNDAWGDPNDPTDWTELSGAERGAYIATAEAVRLAVLSETQAPYRTDAEFIARARTDVPALLATIDALTERLAESRRETDQAMAAHASTARHWQHEWGIVNDQRAALAEYIAALETAIRACIAQCDWCAGEGTITDSLGQRQCGACGPVRALLR